MNTLQIGINWFPVHNGSGLDRMFHGLVGHLPTHGVQTRGLVLGRDAEIERLSAPVASFASPNQSTLSQLWGLRRAVRRHVQRDPLDLIAPHFSLHALPVLDLAGSKAPLVFHFHGPWALESKVEGDGFLNTQLKSFIETVVYKRTQRFIVLSSAFRDLLTRTYDVAPHNVDVVPGGVDIDRFDCTHTPREARLKLDWPLDRPIILSVRRLVRRVGLESLVDAMAHLGDRMPAALLLMAGRGPLADELKAQIKEKDLQHSVRLLGFLPEEKLPLAYRAANLSVLPTRALEGFGLPAVESLAAGTPVFVTPIGGLPEVVEDLSEQLILDRSSPDCIADRLRRALEGKLDLPSSSACQRYAQDRFAWPVVASQVKNVYEKVIQ